MSICELFADILDYPNDALDRAIAECILQLGRENAEAAGLLRSFQAAQERLDLGRLQEVYADGFDLLPDCSLNLGYHLFGDDWRRSTFLADLVDRYRACGFHLEKELPDHLCVVLRFLARQGQVRQGEPLIEEFLVPTLAKILQSIKREVNPYGTAIESLLVWLRAGSKPLSEEEPNAAARRESTAAARLERQ